MRGTMIAIMLAAACFLAVACQGCMSLGPTDEEPGVVALQSITRYVYNDKGQVVREDEFFPPNVTHEEEYYEGSQLYEYDGRGNKLADITIEITRSGKPYEERLRGYESLKDNTLTMDAVVRNAAECGGSAKENRARTQSLIAGCNLSPDISFGGAERYAYDDSGRMVEKYEYSSYGNLTCANRYQYDEFGNLAFEESATPGEGMTRSEHELKYDEQNRLVFDSYDQHGIHYDVTREYEGDRVKSLRMDKTYTFMDDERESYREDYAYDDQGRLIGQGSDKHYKTFEYDSEGRLVRSSVAVNGKQDSLFWTYRYDDQGRLIERGNNVEVRDGMD